MSESPKCAKRILLGYEDWEQWLDLTRTLLGVKIDWDWSSWVDLAPT